MVLLFQQRDWDCESWRILCENTGGPKGLLTDKNDLSPTEQANNLLFVIHMYKYLCKIIHCKICFLHGFLDILSGTQHYSLHMLIIKCHLAVFVSNELWAIALILSFYCCDRRLFCLSECMLLHAEPDRYIKYRILLSYMHTRKNWNDLFSSSWFFC